MAVELLIRTTDGPAGRMRGDIVSAKQVPNKGWGKGEDLPNYLVIRIDDANLDVTKKYSTRHVKLNPLDNDSPSKRSNYRLNLDTLPNIYAKERPHLILSKSALVTNVILRGF